MVLNVHVISVDDLNHWLTPPTKKINKYMHFVQYVHIRIICSFNTQLVFSRIYCM